MKKKYYFTATVILLSVFACTRQHAQFPSNKENRIDSTTINLRTMNEVLTQKEDSVLEDLVKKQTVTYNKTSSGIWYHKEVETKNDSLVNFQEVIVNYDLCTIDGAKIKNENIKVEFGKKQVTLGMEEGLKLMRKGEKIKLIVPWYLGYGMKGKDNIPSYTSLVYEISTQE